MDLLIGSHLGETLLGQDGEDKLTNQYGGNDELIGGAGADVFDLYRAGGSVEIMDLDAGLDIIDLRRLDYADTAEALSHVTSTANGDVTFSDTGFDLLVHNTNYAEFADSLMV